MEDIDGRVDSQISKRVDGTIPSFSRTGVHPPAPPERERSNDPHPHHPPTHSTNKQVKNSVQETIRDANAQDFARFPLHGWVRWMCVFSCVWIRVCTMCVCARCVCVCVCVRGRVWMGPCVVHGKVQGRERKEKRRAGEKTSQPIAHQTNSTPRPYL